MAIVCKDHSILYIQVPGTGCSVVSRVLHKEYGGKDLGRKHNDVQELLDRGLLTPSELRDYTVIANIRNPFDRWVTYYQRLRGDWIEEYLSFRQRDLEREAETQRMTDEEYSDKWRWLKQHASVQRRRAWTIRRVGFNTWLLVTIIRWRFRDRNRGPDQFGFLHLGQMFPMLSNVDFAIRQEALDEGFQSAMKLVGIQDPAPIPQKNQTSGKKPYADYYNWLTKRLLSTVYKDELTHLGYQFDGARSGEPALVDLGPLRVE